MSTLLRCPRCKSEVDASASKPGSVIKCLHCRADMRVPDAPSGPGPAKVAGGRQSTLFRRMTNAALPGQRGRVTAGPTFSGEGRGASRRGSDMSGLYVGGGVVGVIAIAVVIGVMMSQKSAEPGTPGGPKKLVAHRQPPPPPPPEAPPPEPVKPPSERGSGPPSSWEPDAASRVLAGVNPVPCESALEKEALGYIRSGNTDRINSSPYHFLPFVLNSLISEDRDLAKGAFAALAAFCEHQRILLTGNKNPVDLGWVNSAEYRGYIYQDWAGKWWSQNARKLIDAPIGPGELAAVDKVDWHSLVQQLIGGSYHDSTTPSGATFLKVKAYGRAAWPKLANLIDHEDLSVARAAAEVLNELTGQKRPRPTEANRAEVKAGWLSWISSQK
jgi:hypothetical protein